MSEHLFIRYAGGATCSWVIVNSQGRLVQRTRKGQLEDAATAARGRRVTVLVPGTDVVTTTAEMPKVSLARQRQMLPYALEDQFADDVDRLYFAPGPTRGSGGILVSVVSRQKLEIWLEGLEAAGIAAHAIYCESDGVTNTPATVNIMVDGDTLYCREPDMPAQTLQGIGLAAAVTALRGSDKADDAATQHAYLYMSSAAKEQHSTDIALLENEFSSVNVRLIVDDVLAAFAANLVHAPGTNLLQGEFAPRTDVRALLQPWRLAAGLLVALAGVGLLGNVAELVRLGQQETALQAAIASTCQAAFAMADQRPCELEAEQRLRASGQLESGSGTAGFLAALEAVATDAGPQTSLQSVSYRAGTLDLQLVARDVPALDQLSRSINSDGVFTVAVQSTNPQLNGRVEARIQIVGVAP